MDAADMVAQHLSEAKEAYLREGQRIYIGINGGGAVALLAFLQAIWGRANAAELIPWVLYGLIAFAGGVAIGTATYPLRHRAFVIGAKTDQHWLYRLCYWWLPTGAVVTFLCGLGLPVVGAFLLL